MPIVLDEATRAEYLAQSLASSRASLVVAALTGTVVVEVYDGANVLRASGTMASPWATSSGSTITIGEVNAAGLYVSSGGAPDSLWYCQFRSGTRFVRGSFGVSTDTADFKWSLSSFQTGSRGTLGTVTLAASGTALPSLVAAPVISGTTQVGQTLTMSTGTWASDTTLTYARQWRRNGSDIAGQTSATLALSSADLGATIGGFVTATNSFGATVANAANVGPVVAAGDPTGLPRLQAADVTYLGYFAPSNINDVDFSSAGSSVNHANGELYFGRGVAKTLVRVQPPTTISGQSIGYLTTPVTIPYDVSSGSNKLMGGTLVYNGKLLALKYSAYDTGGTANDVLQYTTDLTGLTGWSTLRTIVPSQGGYRGFNEFMGHIPAEWQSLFGGPALIGAGMQSIQTSCTCGPAAAVFNPDDVVSGSPVSLTTVLYYPYSADRSTHLADDNVANDLYSRADTHMGGVVFPSGTRSVLFIGRHGYGTPTYKSTTADPCDPSGAGDQAYPYRLQVWAYDANDLLAVKNGTMSTYAPRPYAWWELAPPPSTNWNSCINTGAGSVTYDPTLRRIYVLSRETVSYGWPRVHVWQVA